MTNTGTTPDAGKPTPTPAAADPSKGTTVVDPNTTGGGGGGTEPAPDGGGVKPDGGQDPNPTSSAVPEKYELTLPEGTLLTDADVEKTIAHAKASGLSNEDAQGVLNFRHEAVADYQARAREETKGWLALAKKDKKIGGEHFEKNIEMAKRLVTRHGDKNLTDFINQTRIGDHPTFLRFLVSIANSMAEDTLVTSTAPVTKAKSIEDRMYPNQG